jgi:tRNA threonylcarbamoyladenosine biosynthesis protein TsaB
MKLGIETSTRNCSVVLWDNRGRFYSREKSETQFVHAEQLHNMIQEVITEANANWRDLEAVVIGRGPGSYTGLRIGVSCAKGICFSLQIPLCSISSLTLMVQSAPEVRSSKNVLAVMDARRMEVFGGWFDNGRLISTPQAMIFEDHETMDSEPVEWVIGENASKLKDVFDDQVRFLDVLPSANVMRLLDSDEFFQLEDLAYFEPEYVKPFIPTISKK